MQQLERHPLSKLWPDIPSNEFAELKADIAEHGQRYPIIVYDKQILDGWHRYKACTEIGRKPNIEKFSGTPEAAAKTVNSLNAHRRNISASQRAFAITGCFEWARANVKGRGSREPLIEENEENSKTNAEMAQASGASRSTVKRSKKVHESGSAALKEAVKAGEISINKAAAVVDLPKSEQLAAATAKPEKAESPTLPPEAADDWAPDEDTNAQEEEAERVYAESIDKVMGSDDKLKTAHAVIKQLTTEFAQAKIARDGYMDGKRAITKLLKAEQRKTAKLTKENKALRERLEAKK